MATDYSKLTREELLAAFKALEQGYARLTMKAKEDGQLIEDLQGHVDTLTNALAKEARATRKSQEAKAIALDVSASLARAWTDMVEYLHD